MTINRLIEPSGPGPIRPIHPSPDWPPTKASR